ncbi:MAG: DUF2975 domain-containing protein [Lachnospiraceae bacterium]|nr:DUF2975 domain-containing protein [Lachnospiraceae bacterium]
MKQKHLANWLKIMIIGVGICAILVYTVVLPVCGQAVVDEYPEFANRFRPWMIFLCSTGVLFFTALVCCFRIATNIGKDCSFSLKNAKLLQWISNMAIGDTAYFFAGNFVMLALNLSHPGVMLASLMVDVVGIAIGVATAALSHLVYKAAEMKEENDYTI